VLEVPGKVAMLRMLHAFPDELHPETAPSVLRDHEHVAQPRHARAVRDHAREPDLLLAV
jgi:hypothetical protein